MKLRRFNNIKEFWDNAQDYLLQHMAEHNLLLGIYHTLLYYPDRYPEPSYLAIVYSNNKILAVAIRTPPHKLVLSKAEDLNALTLIAEDLQEYTQLPGVTGLVVEVEAFLQSWQTLNRQSHKRVKEMRIYELTEVKPVTTTNGYLRLATQCDRPLLLKWFEAFETETGQVITQDIGKAVNSGLQRQSIYLWEDDIPVSLASGTQSLPAAARIGPVYTPVEYRRQGYATACVAALSQKLIDQGCHSCFLFTELANPTSNHIYQAIGYRPICNWHDYSFIIDN